jgi:hypothetical protein
MASQNAEFRIDSQEDIVEHNHAREAENECQGAATNDKELVKEGKC